MVVQTPADLVCDECKVCTANDFDSCPKRIAAEKIAAMGEPAP